jgi:hypothetical protein
VMRERIYMISGMMGTKYLSRAQPRKCQCVLMPAHASASESQVPARASASVCHSQRVPVPGHASASVCQCQRVPVPARASASVC